MITIVDYGVGNIRAFLNAYKLMNVDATTATTAEALADAEKVILPGVGAFDEAMQRLNASGMRAALDNLVLQKHVPVLGVCVGMQMLGHSSDEGREPGLGWIDGKVRRLDALSAERELRMPHMGWNDISPTANASLFPPSDEPSRFYFLHSYYFECTRAQDVAATANYGTDFACAVQSDNIFGVQFHPEKSHHFGTQLLKAFATL